MELNEDRRTGIELAGGERGPLPEPGVDSQKSILDALLAKREQLVLAIQQIETALRETQQQLGRRLEELRKRRQPLDEALSHVEALLKIEGWESKGDEASPVVLQQPGLNEKGPNEAAHDLLVKLGKPIHYRELAAKLLADDVPISGQNPAATLLSKINRDARFRRYDRGVYGLASWNLRIRRGSKKRRRSRGRKG